MKNTQPHLKLQPKETLKSKDTQLAVDRYWGNQGKSHGPRTVTTRQQRIGRERAEGAFCGGARREAGADKAYRQCKSMSDEAGQAGKAENGERSGREDAEDHNLNAPCKMEVPVSLGGECDNDSGISAVGGGASEEAGGKVKMDRQDATALMMDKALKKYGSLKVMDDAKKCLKEMAKTFLEGLLSREELVVRGLDPC